MKKLVEEVSGEGLEKINWGKDHFVLCKLHLHW